MPHFVSPQATAACRALRRPRSIYPQLQPRHPHPTILVPSCRLSSSPSSPNPTTIEPTRAPIGAAIAREGGVQNGSEARWGRTKKTTVENVSAEDFKSVMRKVPSQVVVVTLATPNEPYPHLGITCSSFTSVSLTPSIISFSVREPSRCAKLFSASPNQEFAVHILSSNQAGHSAAFSSPLTQHVFKTFEHDVDEKSGLVVMRGSLGVLMCQAVANVTVGDHTAWFGKVTRIIDANAEGDPLLYYGGAYRTVAKEDCSFCNGTPEH